MADIARGSGPNALPYGAAKRLNDTAAPTPQGPDVSSDIPVEYGKPATVNHTDLGDTPNNQLLTMPPDPNFKTPPSYRGEGMMPRNLIRLLPVIGIAAKGPEAPLALRAYYEAMVARLEAEQNA